MEFVSPEILQEDQHVMISRARFMYEALEGIELDESGLPHELNSDINIAKSIITAWTNAGGERHLFREVSLQEHYDPDSPIMDDEIDLTKLYERMRLAESGNDELARRTMMSGIFRWNLYCKLVNTYLFNGEQRILPWDNEIHSRIRVKNPEARLGGYALLKARYNELEL